MLTDLKQQNEVAMTELGLLIPAEEIYNPGGIALKDAVVHFGGGCTGEVISAEGLVLTNHHCGYGAIQQHSSVEHDYLTDGFWAMSRSEELPCKGLTVTYIDEIMDVTDYVNEQLQIDSDPNGTNYLSPKYLTMVADRFLSEQGITLTPGPQSGTESILWRKQILLVSQDHLQRYSHGRRAPLFYRKVRSRYGQLDVAAPHRRLLPIPHLCRQERTACNLQSGQYTFASKEAPHYQPCRLPRR